MCVFYVLLVYQLAYSMLKESRVSEFSENDEDSILTIDLTEVREGTKITLTHKNIPKGQTQYEQGWIDHYFVPMKEYFK